MAWRGVYFPFRQDGLLETIVSFAGIILFVFAVVWVIRSLRRDFQAGMRTIFGLLVFLPASLAIPLPSGLPQLTIHRVLILVGFWFVMRNSNRAGGGWRIPNLGLVVLFGFAQLMSLAFGIQFVSGLKGFLSYALEAALLYILVSEYVRTQPDLTKLLSSMCYGLAAVAIVAYVEKYLHFNPATKLLPETGLAAQWGWEQGDIVSTYAHRILLGYAMAIGVVLALALSAQSRLAKPRRVMQMIALLLIGATYFSASRGPWLGLGLALAAMGVVGGRGMRLRVALIGFGAALVLILRPGVRETIQNLYSATLDEESLKGNSYNYRWRLWVVAWSEIQRSPERLLFGFGPGSTESMDLTEYFYGHEGYSSSMEKIGFTSWDNAYACDLIELGVFGCFIELMLHVSILWTIFANWRRTDSPGGVLEAGIAVGCVVFMFAMTNVSIFAPQLKYMFWALAAAGSSPCGIRRGQRHVEESKSAEEEVGGTVGVAAGLTRSAWT